MKKFLAAAFIAFSINASAQEFSKDDNIVSAGIGFGGALGGYTYSSQSPGLSLQYERGIVPVQDVGVIGIGAYVGIKSRKYETAYGPYYQREKWNYTIIGARGAFHLTNLGVDKLDVYGGIMLSYNILSYKYTDNDPFFNYATSGSYGSTVGFSVYAGGRYYVAPNVAAFLELGYGISYVNLGVAMRFK
jgi:hypothetical protein